MTFGCSFADLHSIHIHDGIIEFSTDLELIKGSQTCSTIRLSKISFIVSSGVKEFLSSSSLGKRALLWASNSTLALEDCVLETSFDSPALAHLVVCAAKDGGQVWHRSPGMIPCTDPLACCPDKVLYECTAPNIGQ
jgi:hypothetical protein